MKCPKCGKYADEVAEEVDIGVGVQKFVTGYECYKCQWHTSVCEHCGVTEDASKHHSWCISVRDNDES